MQLRKSLWLKLGVKPGKVSFAERVSRVASTTGPPLNLLEQERRDRAKATKRDAHRMSESLATNFIKALSVSEKISASSVMILSCNMATAASYPKTSISSAAREPM